MRAVWFIGKFELDLNCTKMKIIHPNPAHRNSRKTLVASGFEHSNNHDNLDEIHLISLTILTYEMTHFSADT